MQDAVAAGFDFNGPMNGVAVLKGHGPHLNYNKDVMNRLEQWAQDNPNYTPEMAKMQVEKLANILRKKFE